MLNSLTIEEIEQMRNASRHTAQLFNADKEMRKMLELYRELFKSANSERKA